MVDLVEGNIAMIRGQIDETARSVARASEEIKLMAVSKTRAVTEMLRAAEFSDLLGENRVQEASAKWAEWPVANRTPWHLIGHLQKNKARKALEIFDVIESVDTFDLARTLDRILAEGRRRVYPVFIEVNMSGEISKSGVEPSEAESLIERILTYCPNLSIEGLMTIGPLTNDEDLVRRAFSGLRTLRDQMRDSFGLPMRELSMGMSDDFRIAVEEGSTIVRLGTAIFGARQFR